MVRPLGTCSTVLAVSVLALLVGCSGESDPSTQPAISSDASTSQSPSESGAPSPEGVVLMSDLTEGSVVPGRYAGLVAGGSRSGELPLAVVKVPSGYLAGGASSVFVDQGGFRHLDLWTVSKVVEDPYSGPVYTDPGPSVQDLADALAALPVWKSTKPKPVTIGGYQGLVMDFDVPDPTPSGCGDQPSHWVDEVGGVQGIGPGKRQRLWILDVAGERVMILAGWFPVGSSDPSAGVTPAQTKELTDMAESATFRRPACPQPLAAAASTTRRAPTGTPPRRLPAHAPCLLTQPPRTARPGSPASAHRNPERLLARTARQTGG